MAETKVDDESENGADGQFSERDRGLCVLRAHAAHAGARAHAERARAEKEGVRPLRHLTPGRSDAALPEDDVSG
eukprot:835540-Heterocapsa_arctica.AAC.1